MKLRLLKWVIPLFCLGCFDAREELGQQSQSAKPPSTISFADRLLEIAKNYQSYQVMDRWARWAPGLCLPITSEGVKGIRPKAPEISASTDTATHGRKLYYMFASKVTPAKEGGVAYVVKGKPSPVGQAIVKEAWTPEECNSKDVPLSVARNNDSFCDSAYADGKCYRAKEKSALFIMFKLDPKTPGTDEGWVYGTVTPDAKKILSVGKVESCMKCHQEAPHDRLFGLPGDK
jgi:hypothetical protein